MTLGTYNVIHEFGNSCLEWRHVACGFGHCWQNWLPASGGSTTETAEVAAFAGKSLVFELAPQLVRITEWLQERSPSMDPFLEAAIEEARQGRREGGIPIGSVIVHCGRIISRGHNRRVQQSSAILHGEMDALENAGRRSASVYRESVLYTTLSPCSMCSGAILLYGIPKVIVGENRTFLGEEELLRSRGVTVEVLQEPACIQLMEEFIAAEPQLWNEDIGVPESRPVA